MITEKNFFINTAVVFKECKRPKRLPDFESKSGSKYWYGKDHAGHGFVIRESDHWSYRINLLNLSKKQLDCRRIATCVWSLKMKPDNYFNWKTTCGKAFFKEFEVLI